MEKDIVDKTHRVVAIGGSAGSLEVIIKMLDGLKNTNVSLIVIIHRKGSLHSTLPQLLSLKSSIAVKEAEEKEPVRPGHVDIGPADYHLLIESDGTFSLDDSEKVNFSRPSIDVTFECAAEVFGSAVIGILLSGGNSDGVEGLKKIKKAGGYCVVQDPQTALVSFMPQHALTEMQVDRILRDDELAAFLNDIT